MKKSRIIIPALAVMALSMGAAVTSTVAWFTANRNAQSTSNNITIINPEGGLAVTGAVGSGTTFENTETGLVTATHHGKLRDASVNLGTPAAPTVWTSVYNAAGEVNAYRQIKPSSNNDIGQSVGNAAGWIDSGAAETAVYGAYSYGLNFVYGDENTRPGTYGLFIDAKTSVMAGAPNDLRGALRIALVCGNTVKVFAPDDTKVLREEDSYVTGVGSTANYISENIASEDALVDYTSSSANMLESQKTLSAGAATFTKVMVYTWLEGLDFADYTGPNYPKDFKITLEFKVLEKIGA